MTTLVVQSRTAQPTGFHCQALQAGGLVGSGGGQQDVKKQLENGYVS